jgi:hypothetical protein
VRGFPTALLIFSAVSWRYQLSSVLCDGNLSITILTPIKAPMQ